MFMHLCLHLDDVIISWKPTNPDMMVEMLPFVYKSSQQKTKNVLMVLAYFCWCWYSQISWKPSQV